MMRNATRRSKCSGRFACLLAVITPLSVALAQDAPPAATSETDPKATDPKKDDAPPSLDDLLGIGEESTEADDGAAEAAQREHDEALDRELNEVPLADNFIAAVEKMELVADLLDREYDAGLGTQRAQEDILAKLEALIDQARQQNQQQQQSSSSSQQSQQNRPSPNHNEQQNQGDQQQQQAQNQQQPANDPNNATPGEADPRAAQIGEQFEEDRREWGSLPERVRDMLLQGRQEKFSSMYERLTQEYYKRLAEEG